jgi:hypothetical protein
MPRGLTKHLKWLFCIVVLIHSPQANAITNFNFSLELSNQSFGLPINARWASGNLSLRNRLRLQHIDHPNARYLIQAYDRSNITMLTEFSGLSYTNDLITAEVGRSYLKSSPATFNAPLFSSYAPSLDNVSVTISPRNLFTYDFKLIRLDDRQSDAGVYKRWIYYRRLAVHFGNIHIALKDVVLASGIQRGVDLGYLNPGAVYQLEQLHGRVEAGTPGQNNDNQIMGFDVEYKPTKKFRAYGDFILDEIQVDAADRKRFQDVFGFCVGFEKIGPSWKINLEYFLSSPWLYTNGGEFTNFEFYGRPIGLRAPHSHGFSLAYEMEKPDYIFSTSTSIYQIGSQSVVSEWNSENNKISLFSGEQEWKSELDVTVHFPQKKYIDHLRITYELLDSDGWYLMVGFKLFDHSKD